MYQKGFTLIEMMIVVAILGILSTLALPSYQDRIIKTQVLEGVALADFVKQGVAAYYTRNQKMPDNNDDAGLPPPDKIIGNFVTRVAMEQGTITITYGNRSNGFLAGKKLTLRPAVVEGYATVPIAWVCGMAGAPDKMKIAGNNQTTIPLAHLPLDCAK
ncbi:MAG: Fimbrial protein [Pseudomonadota bacterium]|jgi:type IV pilus assembly protein PilA